MRKNNNNRAAESVAQIYQGFFYAQSSKILDGCTIPFQFSSLLWIVVFSRKRDVYSRFSVHISEKTTIKMKNQIQPVADIMRQIFKKRTKVESVTQTVCNVIAELASGSKKINLAVHESPGEMIYVMVNKGAIITMHIQELEPSKRGGQSC